MLNNNSDDNTRIYFQDIDVKREGEKRTFIKYLTQGIWVFLLTYYTVLLSGMQYNDLTFVTLQNNHDGNSSYHLSPYRINTILLTIVLMVYIIFL